MEKLQMVMGCLTTGEECDESGYVAQVGDTTHLFCCEKAFKQSLVDFLEWENEQRKGHQNN